MGWIKGAFRDLSLKKAFMLYMLLFILLAAALSSISINTAGYIRNRINLKYSYPENEYTLSSGDGRVVIVAPPADYSSEDRQSINLCNFVELWSIPFFFGLCIILSALLFYREKLKKPIELLGGASERISASDLDFHISYDSRDEMGRLVASFETMRTALAFNNKNMWRAMEERKKLNAAFSHDLRTPLTVLRGYADFLMTYLPQGKISVKKLLATVSTMQGQIARLEEYVKAMGEAQKLEDLTVSIKEVETSSFLEQLRSTAKMLTQNTGLDVRFESTLAEKELAFDSAVVLRVYENLMANAVRYAGTMISVRCGYLNDTLSLSVSDDGKGFGGDAGGQNVETVLRKGAGTECPHFGLGLSICKILCEKHGGALLSANAPGGGAEVTAQFLCKC